MADRYCCECRAPVRNEAVVLQRRGSNLTYLVSSGTTFCVTHHAQVHERDRDAMCHASDIGSAGRATQFCDAAHVGDCDLTSTDRAQVEIRAGVMLATLGRVPCRCQVSIRKLVLGHPGVVVAIQAAIVAIQARGLASADKTGDALARGHSAKAVCKTRALGRAHRGYQSKTRWDATERVSRPPCTIDCADDGMQPAACGVSFVQRAFWLFDWNRARRCGVQTRYLDVATCRILVVRARRLCEANLLAQVLLKSARACTTRTRVWRFQWGEGLAALSVFLLLSQRASCHQKE